MLVAAIRGASAAERISTAVGPRLNSHTRQGGNSLIPTISVGGTLHGSCISVGLAILGPSATSLGVRTLHACGISKLLNAVGISGSIGAGPKCSRPVAGGL